MERSSLLIAILLVGGLAFLAGCAAMSPEQLEQFAAARATDAAASQAIANAKATEVAAAAQLATIAAQLTVTPTLTITATATVSPTMVLTETASAAPTPTPPEAFVSPAGDVAVNVRSGPGLVWEPFATLAPGQEVRIIGVNPDRTWWRICCVQEDKPGWVSAQVTRARGEVDNVPVVPPILPDDLTATWSMHWECHSRGCKTTQCEGKNTAQASKVINERWLEVAREATWEDDCGETSTWVVLVDRYSGEEGSPPEKEVLFHFFEGPANLGEANRTITLGDKEIPVWCTEPRSMEEEQGEGWTVVLEGEACYDLRSGVALTMDYVKRWLFTGTYEGKEYEREYFGDYEVYKQVLEETNLELGSSSGP
ncbi:MAG: hypothetical protein GXP39_16735 [Chloroflexi bacterium]|nr:hypothetical protein [Chloroflexota bacterium]